MRSIMLALLVTVTPAAVVTPAMADAPGPLEEAGRLIDQLAGRLGSFGAELAEQVRQGRDRIGSGGGLMGGCRAIPLRGRSSPSCCITGASSGSALSR